MVVMVATKNMKICASCSMWCGQRLLERTQHVAKVDANTFGYCATMRLDKAAQSSCGKWSAWQPLK